MIKNLGIVVLALVAVFTYKAAGLPASMIVTALVLHKVPDDEDT
jgi:hypothetical protein